MRLRELEVHHADLALGYTFGDVPGPAARWIIDDITGTLSGREGVRAMRLEATDAVFARETGPGGPVVTGTSGDLPAWISGRSPGEALSVPGTGGTPPAPFWI